MLGQAQLDEQNTSHLAHVRAVSHDYDNTIQKLQQKHLLLTQELRESKRQELQRELSPLSLRERMEYQDTIVRLQSQLAGTCLAASSYVVGVRSFVKEWALASVQVEGSKMVENEMMAVPVEHRSLTGSIPKILRFTTKSECRQAREEVFGLGR
jgi:hypothetical protein